MEMRCQHVGLVAAFIATALFLAGCGGVKHTGSGHSHSTTTTTTTVECPPSFNGTHCNKCWNNDNKTQCQSCDAPYRLTRDSAGEESCVLPRGQRLCDGELKVLYHQTTMEACTEILKTGFDIGRAKAGNQGMGAYFADDAAKTGSKTRHTGCVITLLARLGSVFDMGNKWLPDMGRHEDGCDVLFGYKLMNESFDSVTTIKHGRERALFFDDQILDMIAYPCSTSWGNGGTQTGPWINGRSQLNPPDKCDPNAYPEYTPPVCKFDDRVQDKACAGFTNVGCYTTGNGNVDNGEQCKDATVLKTESLDWNTCQKDCFAEPMCKGFQFHVPNECIQYSNEPSSFQAGEDYSCMKKVTTPGGNETDQVTIPVGSESSLIVI